MPSNLPQLDFPHFMAIGIGLYLLWALAKLLRRLWRGFRAMQHVKRYEAEKRAYEASNFTPPSSAPRGSYAAYQQQQNAALGDPDYVKGLDARVQGTAEPQGFWTRLVMGEKMHLIREMIRIGNSDEHRGYWQDRVEAQRRTEPTRQVGDEGQGR